MSDGTGSAAAVQEEDYALIPQDDVTPDTVDEKGKWELKKLSPKHKQVAALVAQGMKLVQVGAIVELRPEYISMLLRQPLMKQYIQQMSEAVGTRMEALFEQTVEVIADEMANGSGANKLKAARLQLEATKRIGRPDPSAGGHNTDVDRLTKLAERLLYLQSNQRLPRTFDESGNEITDVEPI